MKIKSTSKKQLSLIKNRIKTLIDSGREIDAEEFAKNIGVDVKTIEQLFNELQTELPSDYIIE